MVQIQSQAGSHCTTATPQSFVSNIFWAKPEDYRKATQRVYHIPGQAGFIELPLVATP
jgi:predicted acyl esterase